MRPRIGWKGAIKRSGTAEIAEEERIGGGEGRIEIHGSVWVLVYSRPIAA